MRIKIKNVLLKNLLYIFNFQNEIKTFITLITKNRFV